MCAVGQSMFPSDLHHANKRRKIKVQSEQRLLLLPNPICLTHRGREGGRKRERVERGRGGRRMRTRPDQAEAGAGGGRAV